MNSKIEPVKKGFSYHDDIYCPCFTWITVIITNKTETSRRTQWMKNVTLKPSLKLWICCYRWVRRLHYRVFHKRHVGPVDRRNRRRSDRQRISGNGPHFVLFGFERRRSRSGISFFIVSVLNLDIPFYRSPSMRTRKSWCPRETRVHSTRCGYCYMPLLGLPYTLHSLLKKKLALNFLQLPFMCILSCKTLGFYQFVNCFFQVYPDGIRHICADKRVNEWKAGKKQIVKCAVNQRQVVIALSGGELVYFEMDPVSLF